MDDWAISHRDKKYPFLPAGHEQGWLPYLWLFYLLQFLITPVEKSAGWQTWLGIVCGLAVFFPLYFRGYWLRGRRVLWIIAALSLLPFPYARDNGGSVVFFIYASSFVGQLDSMRDALLTEAAIVLLIGTISWAWSLPTMFWVFGLFFSAFIAAIALYRMQSRRMHRRLELAHDEVERLAKIAERERISRDLHDLLGHTLSLIVLKSELASKLADRDPARALDEIHHVERISRDALAQVRSAVKGYRSAGLAAEIEHAASTLASAGVTFDCHAESIRLPAAEESVLVLALREAVTNIVRHSSARSCGIHIERCNGAVRLEIVDDGAGTTAAEGFGIRGMRERIESIGGTLERNGDRGMRLVICLPVSPVSGAA